jgi:hypothetical protein
MRSTENTLRVLLRALRASVVFFFLAAPSALLACPFCKETTQDSSQSLAEGFNASTLVMLGGLFSLVGFSIYLFVRAARPVSDAGAPEPPGPSSALPGRNR